MKFPLIKIVSFLILFSSCGQATRKADTDNADSTKISRDSALNALIRSGSTTTIEKKVSESFLKSNIDSLFVISNYQAIKSTDSINFPLGKNIWSVTINSMKKYGYDPKEYYISKNEYSDSTKLFMGHILDLFKLEGLKFKFYCEQQHYKIIYEDSIKDGDIITIDFSKDLKEVVRII